jgi:hypothetical protein
MKVVYMFQIHKILVHRKIMCRFNARIIQLLFLINFVMQKIYLYFAMKAITIKQNG